MHLLHAPVRGVAVNWVYLPNQVLCPHRNPLDRDPAPQHAGILIYDTSPTSTQCRRIIRRSVRSWVLSLCVSISSHFLNKSTKASPPWRDWLARLPVTKYIVSSGGSQFKPVGGSRHLFALLMKSLWSGIRAWVLHPFCSFEPLYGLIKPEGGSIHLDARATRGSWPNL